MNPSPVSPSYRRPSLPAWRLSLAFGLTLLGLVTNASATTYYVKNGGNNNLNGTSDANAWETIAKVNGTQLAPGDRVLFKRGSTWSGTQLTVNTQTLTSEGQRVIYGSYSGSGTYPGTGALPIITTPPANQLCVSIVARKYVTVENLDLRNAVNGLNSQGSDFINILGVSVSNTSKAGLLFRQGGNIMVDGCTVTQANANGGIYFNGTAPNALHDVTVQNCYVHDMTAGGSAGGIVLHGGASDSDQLGANFTIRDNVVDNSEEQAFGIVSGSNILLENNESSNSGNGGITVGHSANHVTVRYHYSHDEPRGAGDSSLKISVDTVTVEYSKFIGNTFSSPVVLLTPTLYQSGHPLAGTPDARPENVTLRNNTFVWNSTSNGNIFHVAPTNGHTADIDNLTMKNNIWGNRSSTGIPTMNFSQANRPPNYATYAIRNNLYDDAPVTAWKVGSTNYANFAAYKTAYNPSGTWLEKTGNPGFVSNSDYHLASSSSPAYNAAENIGLLDDFDGVDVPQGGARDIGAYELPVAGTTPGTPTSLTATRDTVNPTSQINLVWSNVANETGYNVERKTGAGGTYAEIAQPATNVTTLQNTGLQAGTQYYYRVRAHNGAIFSGYSPEANASTQAAGTPVTYDANALTISASSGETSSAVAFTGASNNDFLLYPSDAIGDFVSFNVTVPVANIPYAISVKYHENDFRGIVQLLIDGSNQGSAFDAHKENPAQLTTVALGSKTFTTTGNHTFRFQITNKNAGSQGFQIGLDTITLTP